MTRPQQKTSDARKCGECTLCCYLLPVASLKKDAGVLCKHCVLTKGCAIYNSRPADCREFRCAYYQMDKVSVDLRPDNCKIIFEKVSDTIFFGTQDPRFEMTQVAKAQIQSFNSQGFSVIISTQDKGRHTYLAKNHTERQIKREVQQFLEGQHGST